MNAQDGKHLAFSPHLDTPATTVADASVALRVWRRLGRRFTAMLPALLPALLFLPVVLSPPLNHDVAAVLQFSQRWLDGEHLYSDLIDVNPPLIYVLNLIPAAIAKYTPLDGVQALQLCLLAYGGFALWLALRVRDRASEGAVERAFLDVLPLLFLLDAGYDFGQREHLMAVGALPYILSASRRSLGEQPRGRAATGLLAGVAFALKPHFLAVPALVEMLVLAGRWRGAASAGLPGAGWKDGLRAALRTTVRDRVLWLMGAVWLAYLISLPVVFSDYLEIVVPLVWDYYLDLGGLSAVQVLLVPRMATVLCLLLPMVCITFSHRLAPLAARPRMLAAGALGALASAVAQHKGWSYHIVPIELFSCGLGGVLVARWIDRLPVTSPSPSRIAAALTGLFALYAIANGEAPWRELTYSDGDVAGLTALLEQSAAGEPVLVLSPAIYPIFPALNYAHTRLTLRTMDMWLLEGAYGDCLPDGRRYREVWEMNRAEFFVFRTVAEDFARNPPAAVVVDKEPGIPFCGKEFNFIEYFSRHPLFAETWSHYQLTGEWDRFRVYTRKD
jgi:hypothetical protein